MFTQKKHGTNGKSRGFTLLLAALVTSIVLALGTSIFSIAQKELTLSSIGRDSQFAFYAADSGAECALYWDIQHNYFASSAPAIIPSCAETDLDTDGHSSVYPYTVTFQFEPHGYCVNVAVTKEEGESEAVQTVIRADGFSTSCASISTSPRALQRSVEIQY